MSDTSNNQSSTSTAMPSGDSSLDSAAQVRILEERLKGLQTALNMKDSELKTTRQTSDATIASMTQENLKLQSNTQDFASQLKTLQDQLSTVTKELDVSKTVAATKDKELFQTRAVTKHPELLDDYDAGRLRTDLEGDAFIKHLDDWTERLNQAIGQKKAQTLRGSTPSSGSTRQEPVTPTALQDQLRQATDPTEINRIYQQILDLPPTK